MGVYGSPEMNSIHNIEQTNHPNMGYCIYCGFYYSNKLKKCPRCGKKTVKKFRFGWLLWSIAAIILVSAILAVGKSTSYNTNTISINTAEEDVISEDEYKALCSTIPYGDIARNPNDYIGQKTVYKGKVIQVQESGNDVVLRINVTQGDYGLWDDTIYVDYHKKSDGESRILEDDIVTIYGGFKGIKSYTAVLGNQIAIPHIEAEYIDMN